MTGAAFTPPEAGDYGILTSTLYARTVDGGGVYDMRPMPPSTSFHPCTRCGLDIEPLEPFHQSSNGAVTWCDSCMADEESEL